MNIYQTTVAFVNSIPVGGIFTTEQFHTHMEDLGYKDSYQPYYRINTYRTYLRSAGFLSNPKRGQWTVNYSIPTWLTLSALETARNYKGTQAQRKAIQAKIKEYQSTISAKATVAPFKEGDKVIYTPNPKSHYGNSDYYAEKAGLIPGGEYQIKTISKHASRPDCWWVTIKDRSFTLASDCFVPALTVKAEAPAPKPKRQAVCIDMSDSTAEYVIGQVYEITSENDRYYFLDGRHGGMFKWRFKEITDIKVVEPKPVETPLPEVFKSPFKVGDKVRFIQSKAQSSFYEHASRYSRLTDNAQYKVTNIGNNGKSEWDDMFIDVAGCEYHHPYDCFELVVTEPMPEDQFTVGVTFTEEGDNHKIEYTIKEITSAGITLQWKSRAGKTETYTVTSTYFTNPYPNRFKIVEQKIKVGHKISCSFLNDLKTPKKLYGNGFRMKWETTYSNHFDMGHRTIEEIDIVDGVWAGRLSGTMSIWIALDSIKDDKAMPTLTGVEFKDRGAFIQELEALIEKHKK